MEKIFKYITVPLAGCLLFLAGCSGTDGAQGGDDEIYAIERVDLEMDEVEGALAPSTRMVSGFVVNTGYDPTYGLTNKLGWTLDLTVYKNGVPYAEGQGTFLYNGTYWQESTGQTLYMPNYLFQNVTAQLYPASWTGTILTDQSDPADFIAQDVLEQDGSPYYRATPAHYLAVRMRHSHSMIDFVLDEVNPDDIESVTVTAGGDTYIPFKTAVASREEYLVIIPVGTVNPVINVRTKVGASYHKRLDINPSAVNTCYYVRLVGLELVLEGLSVSNWVTGEAVAGDYSSPTSYPTFRGPVDLEVTVYYDNDVSQTMTFNDKGEAVEKPAGRTIVKVATAQGDYTLPTPLYIRSMVVDLNPYIAAIGQ